jgi:hypothetical protein
VAQPWTDAVISPFRQTVRERGIPAPGYALIGAVDTLQTELSGLPEILRRAPEAALTTTVNGLSAVSIEGGRNVGQVRGWLATSYEDLVVRGERRVVTTATERAVRKRVTRLEDRVAPRAARAAVRLSERKRKLDDSPRAQRAFAAAQKARVAAKRSSDRFHEMNAPVFED